MKHTQNIPKLRFLEFEGEWELKRFNNIINSYRLGGNYSNTELPTSRPLIKMGNLGRGNILLGKIEYVPEEEELNPFDIAKSGDLFFNTRNTLELVGKVAIWKNELPFAIYNSNLMKLNFENNFFMNYRLNSYSGIKGLRRLATGTTSVAAIYTKDLLLLNLFIPSLPEQTKIATFLTAVDDKIQQLTKKKSLLERYKKGVMQKIFSQEIRFKQDDGTEFPEWEQKKFLECFASLPSKKHQIKTTEFQFDGKYKVIDQGQDTIAGYSDDKSLLFTNIPIIVFGDHTTTLKYIDFDFIVGADGTKLLKNKKDSDLKYLFYNLSFNNVKPEGYKRHFTALNEIIMQIPSQPEQTKIANFLSAIDEKIYRTENQIQKTQEWKKGLLQQLFV